MKNLRLVIDTNVFRVALTLKGKYHWIYRAVMNRKVELLVSNEILTKYDEVCGQRYPKAVMEELIYSLITFRTFI